MPPRVALLLPLLASTACAQITTSYLLPNATLGTNRLRYEASIIGASDDRVTLVANVPSDPDFEALGNFQPVTYTLAPTLVEASTTHYFRYQSDTNPPGGYAYSYRCDIQPEATTAACTTSRGSSFAAEQCHFGYTASSRSAEEWTQLWTFSEQGEKGTETIRFTIPGSPGTKPVPDWCGTAQAASQVTYVPESEIVRFSDEPRSNFGMFQFVITAGEEKLGSGRATPTPTPTETGAQPEGSGEAPKETGSGSVEFPGSAPMKTMAPALAGMGAAMAMFL